MNEPIRIVVADDHPIFRHGLSAVISKDSRFAVVGEASDGTEALTLAKGLRPDVLVLDVEMPDRDGIEVARQLRQEGNNVPIVILTMYKDRNILRSMTELNLSGYVLKDAGMHEIVGCLETVLAGGVFVSPALAGDIREEPSISLDPDTVERIGTLTKTERVVLGLISESRKSREIADRLYVSERTVETHRYNISLKLGLTGPHALFKFAIQNRTALKRYLKPDSE